MQPNSTAGPSLRSAACRLTDAQRVGNILQEAIRSGLYSAGDSLPAERDLAAELGASRTVVRAALAWLQEIGLVERACGGRTRVGRSTSFGNGHVARALRRQERSIAAVITQPLVYVTGHSIVRGIGKALRQAEGDYQLVLFDTCPTETGVPGDKSEAQWERQFLERIAKEGASGVVIWHLGGDETLPIVRRIQSQGIPVVMIDRYAPGFDCDFVGINNRAAISLPLEHLMELGHRRIGFVSNSDPATTVQQRIEAWKATMAANGLPAGDELHCALSYGGEGDPVSYFLSLQNPPTALQAVNDATALRCLACAREAGLRVPEDISIAGFDNLEAYSTAPAVLTTVHQPWDQMGEEAGRLLVQRLKRPWTAITGPFTRSLVPTSLVVRSSCGPPKAIRLAAYGDDGT